MNTDLAAEAIYEKWGPCCDTAVSKDEDGNKVFTITRWDESIAGIPQPDEAAIAQAISELEASKTAKKAAKQTTFDSIKDQATKDYLISIGHGPDV